jgi:enoyl-CoA hydratase
VPETLVRHERSDGVSLLTLDRPEARNALDEALLRALEAAVSALRGDAATRAVVITGAGERSFAAGADVKLLQRLTPSEGERFGHLGRRVFDAVAALPQPVIAAVNGFALGGGLELALACDFIYASERAVLGLVEAELGLVPGFGGVGRLIRRVGDAVAREALFTARRFSAADALACGLVNRVCAPEKLLDEALATARLVATRSPHAIALLKTLVTATDGADARVARDLEAQSFAAAFAHADAREGLAAFLEKRPPAFGER